MKIEANKDMFSRLSTYANFLAVIAPAIVNLVADLGMAAETQAIVGLIGGIIVTLAQSISVNTNDKGS
jgi:hypothetical protein